MRGRVIGALAMLTVVAAAPFVTAVEQSYAVATLMEVEKKQRDHVLFYLYNTPIMREDPYFQVTVRLGDTVLNGLSTPLVMKENHFLSRGRVMKRSKFGSRLTTFF